MIFLFLLTTISMLWKDKELLGGNNSLQVTVKNVWKYLYCNQASSSNSGLNKLTSFSYYIKQWNVVK